MILLSGDVEQNPGPDTNAIAQTLASVLETVRRLEAGQSTILNELKGVRERQEATDAIVNCLAGRIDALENTVASLDSAQNSEPNNELRSLSDQLHSLTSRCDGTENRMRRCNLLFFGIGDEQGENWAASEQKIIKFCSDQLGLLMANAQFERVHRLGRFSSEKRRPIIARLALFKDKQNILALAHKLKGTEYSICEDFSLSTRQARKKLIEFAKTRKQPFKLTFDKVRINDTTYVYDRATDTVVLSIP